MGMRKIVFIILATLLFFSCVKTEKVLVEQKSKQQVVLDWVQIDDPNIPIQLIKEWSDSLSSSSDTSKNYYTFNYRIQYADLFDTYIQLQLYTSLFDKDGKYIKSFERNISFEFPNDRDRFARYVGGGSIHEASDREVEEYESSFVFIRQYKNKDGEIINFDISIIKEYLVENYPKVNVDTYIQLLETASNIL